MKKLIILSSILTATFSYGDIAPEKEQIGGSINCLQKEYARNTRVKNYYRVTKCLDRDCANVILENDITYQHGYREIRKYSIPNNAVEMIENSKEYFSKENKRHGIEIFDLTNETPNEYLVSGGIIYTAVRDLVTAPIRALENAKDYKHGQKRRKNRLAKIDRNYDTILEYLDFLTNDKYKLEDKELDIESCDLLELGLRRSMKRLK